MYRQKGVNPDVLFDAYYNSYLCLTGRLTEIDVISMESGQSVFMHNPLMDKSNDEEFNEAIKNLIDYFSSVNKFVICAELIKLKRK